MNLTTHPHPPNSWLDMPQFAADTAKFCQLTWLGKCCFSLAFQDDLWLKPPEEYGENWHGEA